MLFTQIKYLASWTNVKLSKRLGQRGAEMVEYAIVLACIAVLGAWFYGTRAQGNTSAAASSTLAGSLGKTWTSIKTLINDNINK